MVIGSSVMLRCVESGDLPHCASNVWLVSHFPLAQYIPALPLGRLGIAGRDALHTLVWLNFACFLGILGVTWSAVAPRAGRRVAAVALLALAVSALPLYADAAFGEMLAGFLVVVFATALVTDARPWVIGFAFVAAGATKDVAVPLLLVLAAAIIAPRWRELDTQARRRIVLMLALSAAAAIAVNAGFNWFRYGGVSNSFYAADPLGGLVLGAWPRGFAAALLSPNAGLLFEWPLATALVVMIAIRRRSAWPLVPLILPLAALSAYYFPFGWYAWMNRLSIPWVPAAVLIACGAYPASARAAVDALVRTRARVALAALLAIALALGQFGALSAGQARTFSWLFATDSQCPHPLAEMDSFTQGFRNCSMHFAWSKPPVLLKGAAAAFDPGSLALTLTAALASLSLLLYARRVSPESGLRP